ncbi:hypothetical protein [Mucilaginibacter auburnensis]|uniref:DUF4129 domain-containing protein n=1 Tax=Mucilaginibacter auburnensis TaxID=1457233 RepID=A0A2H9VSP5_9SPHI|nr:hypothetical protein [Mucilaginibacter auburnensis]PJJ83834.1 hypothetical protein CLV57_0829 [Mucilaginibacter auburnensis]
MFRYVTLILLFFSLITGWAFCAVVPTQQKKPLIVQYDTVKVEKRNLDKHALQEYLKQDDFKYDDTYNGVSLWDRFWHWFWSLFDAKYTSLAGRVITYTLFALGVAGVVFLIMKLAGVNPFWVIRGKSANANVPYSEHLENIHELNIDEEIGKAVSVGNYRLAVRMLYLKSLKQLNEAGSIQWDINKTNSQYSNEINNAEQRLHFNLLTRQFEYIWYGEFNIDAKAFAQVSAMFNDLKLKQHERL